MRYRAYGLDIASELALWPDSLGGSGHVDLRVKVIREKAPREAKFTFARETATRIAGACELVVSEDSIAVIPETNTDPATLAQCAAGAGLAMALSQRGRFVIHGSAVALGEVAVCFAGPSGVGKSTLALSLAECGHTLLSDGMTVLDGEARALAGPRIAKIWPDAAGHFGLDSEALERVTPEFEKRFRKLPPPTCAQAPLQRLFLVSVGTEPLLSPLSPAEGLIALVANAFLNDYLAPSAAPELFERAAKVARGVEVQRLVLPDDFAALPEVVRRIVAVSAPKTSIA